MDKENFLLKLNQPYTNTQLCMWLLTLPKCENRDKLVKLSKMMLPIVLSEEQINSLTFNNEMAIQKTKPPVTVANKTTPFSNAKQIKITPTTFKKGDVFLHPIFLHPYVLLEFKNSNWICGMLTTEPNCSEILIACNSRMFSDSYFTKILFTCVVPTGRFLSIYDNHSQVRSIYKKLKNVM